MADQNFSPMAGWRFKKVRWSRVSGPGPREMTELPSAAFTNCNPLITKLRTPDTALKLLLHQKRIFLPPSSVRQSRRIAALNSER